MKLIAFLLATLATLSLAAPIVARSPDDVAVPGPSSTTPAVATGSIAEPNQSSGNRKDYIIIFEKGFSTPDRIVQSFAEKLRDLGATINYQYHTIIQGFSVSLDPAILSSLQTLQDEEYPFIIEQDQDARTYN